MIRFFAKLFAITFLLFATSPLLAPIATAQDNDNGIKLTISPLPIQISAKPNSIIEQKLRVRNSGNNAETLSPGLLMFSADNKSGDPKLHDVNPDDEIKDWISFSPKSVELDPLEWGEVTMTIELPEHAAFGYYFAVSWGRDHINPNAPAATQLIGSVAQLVLLEVDAPGLQRELRIEKFTSDRSWYEFLPVKFTAAIENVGNTHAAPFGSIFISDSQGNRIDEIKINETKGNVLPESRRTFHVTWDRGFPRYESSQTESKTQNLSWSLENAQWWRFGKYQAELVMAYSQDGQDVPITAETTFWVIPWRLLLLVLAIPTVPAVIVYLVMKKRSA